YSRRTGTRGIYTLSLHDALPIYGFHGRLVAIPSYVHLVEPHALDDARVVRSEEGLNLHAGALAHCSEERVPHRLQVLGGFRRNKDRKSTRLNSSHVKISYAVFCL